MDTIGSVKLITYCAVPVSNNAACPSSQIRAYSAYVLEPSSAPYLEYLLNQGGVDWSALEYGFGGGLACFAVGAGVGLIINVIKKFKV